MKIFFTLLCCLSTFYLSAKTKKVNSGYWHAQFQLNETSVLPVTFLLEKTNKGQKISVLNADEVIELNRVRYVKDSIYAFFPTFDTELKARVVKKNKVEGAWYNYAKSKDYAIPFVATNKYKSRFTKLPSSLSVDGKWEVTFDYDSKPEKAMGLFNTFGSKGNIKGTFLTETGDYRFLEGVVSSDSLYLSTLDGSHAFLFRSKMKNDTLWGDFLSGTHYKTVWYATKNENFELRSPDSLTYLVNSEPIKFELPDLDNKTYTYPNAATEGKVTLLQITATWCPNCLDESRYLAQQREEFGDDLEIIAITFEMPESQQEKIDHVKQYKSSLNLDYTFLIGGTACKTCAAELFPMLNHIMSFPTLIFIDKQGEVRRIHTGFSGPGTGDYYANFARETNTFINQLINE